MEITLDVTVVEIKNGSATQEVFEMEADEKIAELLIETSGRALSGMSPHDPAYRYKLALDRHMESGLILRGEEFKKVVRVERK